MMSKKRGCYQQQSKLMNIPQEIGSHIISLLPFDEAIRSKILSKSWCNLCAYMTTIESSLPQCPDNLNPIVAFQLSSHKTNLESCKLHHSLNDIKFGHALNWVSQLVHSKHVQKLTLVNDFRNNKFSNLYNRRGEIILEAFDSNFFSEQRPLFGSPALRFLELRGYILGDGSAFYGSLNLTTLKHYDVTLLSSQNTIADIISNCPSLTNLSIVNCQDFGRRCLRYLVVSSDNLEFLEVRFSVRPLRVLKLHVNAPRLRNLVLGFKECRFCNFDINTPSLDAFKVVDCSASRSFLRYSSGYQTKKAYNYHNGLEQIQCLSVCLGHEKEDAKWLSFVLGKCKHLQTLNLQVVVHETTRCRAQAPQGSDGGESTFWEEEGIADSITYNLRSLYITDFSATDLEPGFIRYVMSNAVNLKKLGICFKAGLSMEEIEITNAIVMSTPTASNGLYTTLR